MKHCSLWMVRVLAISHLLWGGCLLLLSMGLTSTGLRLGFGILGLWLLSLGYCLLWVKRAWVNLAVLITHVLSVIPGGVLIYIGIELMQDPTGAIEGMGLIHALGLLSLGVGGWMIVLASGSIILGLTVLQRPQRGRRSESP